MTDHTGLDTLDYSFADDDVARGNDLMPEQMLWCAVLNLAIEDARNGQETAREWLLFERDDFVMVCTLAGVSPFSVRNAARRLTSKSS